MNGFEFGEENVRRGNSPRFSIRKHHDSVLRILFVCNGRMYGKNTNEWWAPAFHPAQFVSFPRSVTSTVYHSAFILAIKWRFWHLMWCNMFGKIRSSKLKKTHLIVFPDVVDVVRAYLFHGSSPFYADCSNSFSTIHCARQWRLISRTRIDFDGKQIRHIVLLCRSRTPRWDTDTQYTYDTHKPSHTTHPQSRESSVACCECIQTQAIESTSRSETELLLRKIKIWNIKVSKSFVRKQRRIPILMCLFIMARARLKSIRVTHAKSASIYF